MPPVWRGGAEKALRQADHRKGSIARRALVDMKRNKGANTMEKLHQQLPTDHRHDGELDEETTNTRNGRRLYLQPRDPEWKAASPTTPRREEVFSC